MVSAAEKYRGDGDDDHEEYEWVTDTDDDDPEFKCDGCGRLIKGIDDRFHCDTCGDYDLVRHRRIPYDGSAYSKTNVTCTARRDVSENINSKKQ